MTEWIKKKTKKGDEKSSDWITKKEKKTNWITKKDKKKDSWITKKKSNKFYGYTNPHK
tara:strand:- start:698 stop:871 length:174 start_codon:yes stop_codon:yes gene_type:complete